MNIIGSILYIIYVITLYIVISKYGVDGFLYMHYAMIAAGAIGIVIFIIRALTVKNSSKFDPDEIIWVDKK